MSLEKFLSQAVSSWMNEDGPSSEIVLSTRIRLARNHHQYAFPTVFTQEEAEQTAEAVGAAVKHTGYPLEELKMKELQGLEKRVLVEKHLISPNLAEDSGASSVWLSDNEDISLMVNEEDHLRIQCLFPGLQLKEALHKALEIDDAIEQHFDYAFDENYGYLTTCPTNVGTGLRASVMMHLPGLMMTHQMNRIIPAIGQFGLVARGIYGEGSEALGNIFQISNQTTLGKSEEDITEDLLHVVDQIIAQEKSAREALVKSSGIQLEDRVFRSYGTLRYSRVIESKEAAKCLSDVRLGIDLGFIENVSRSILNELMILTQPGFLQQYAGGFLRPVERDIRRASLIRERLEMDVSKDKGGSDI
ncbi:ATP:guanido phosphotransferase [Jeotgalibacillus malaysiensis]|uniref:Protein-arginine kinase n=1 Tax=Jeotgalibacillus malaysiensis TaxID=1508404 RepID=A0A0B5AH69_9BACL|nr:protein arginine kinase [Jeotgalibacillus malaysiensis]AJD89421.1 ATP:guanido phosphotransferase [Jeotgalibacillus malaysiensis]